MILRGVRQSSVAAEDYPFLPKCRDFRVLLSNLNAYDDIRVKRNAFFSCEQEQKLPFDPNIIFVVPGQKSV